MTYSCAIFSRGAQTLEEAQEQKLEMVCTKLALQPGERLLDIGCGWGSFATHAAVRHGVEVTGITLSEPQARVARKRAEDAGVGDRVEIRVMDYRDIAGETYDAIASIGMVEHVGAENIDLYASRLSTLLPSGGRLLNHGIARLRHTDPEAGPFSERYVFPDADPIHLSRVELALERAGFVTEHVEGFAPTTPRRSATGPAGSTRTSTRRHAWPGRSGFASGGSTCERPATASRAASRRSTRSGPGWPERSARRAAVLGPGAEVPVAVVGDDDEILDPDAELARQVDARARP